MPWKQIAFVMKLVKEYVVETKAICFQGNNYSDEWREEAARRGLLNLAKTPEALQACRYTDAAGQVQTATERRNYAASGAHEGESRFGAGAGDLQRRGTSRLGERAVRQAEREARTLASGLRVPRYRDALRRVLDRMTPPVDARAIGVLLPLKRRVERQVEPVRVVERKPQIRPRRRH